MDPTSHESFRPPTSSKRSEGDGSSGRSQRAGLFGVEFFIRGKEAIFSELSPRPHDTGMVTMISKTFPSLNCTFGPSWGCPFISSPSIDQRR